MCALLEMTNTRYAIHVYRKKNKVEVQENTQKAESKLTKLPNMMIIIINMFEVEDTFIWFSICLIYNNR